jgi:hypothetical protein
LAISWQLLGVFLVKFGVKKTQRRGKNNDKKPNDSG